MHILLNAARALKAISYSSQWLNQRYHLPVNVLRTRLHTIRLAKRALNFWSHPKTSLKAATHTWVHCGDAFFTVTIYLKHLNHYISINQHSAYQVVVHVGAVAKISTAAYKILFSELSGLRKFRQFLIIMRRGYFLYGSFARKSHPGFFLTLLTVQLIVDVAIDVEKWRK